MNSFYVLLFMLELSSSEFYMALQIIVLSVRSTGRRGGRSIGRPTFGAAFAVS